MKPIKVLVIEDEIQSFASISRCLQQLYHGCIINGPLTGNSDVLKTPLCTFEQHDIILSDIQLKDGTVFFSLCQIKIDVPIVFVTAYDQYALDAFKAGGVGYILKPIVLDDMKKAVDHALRFQRGTTNGMVEVADSLGYVKEGSYRSVFFVSTGEGFKQISVPDICFFVKEEETVKVVTNVGEAFSVKESLDHLEHTLDPYFFFRATRQHLVHRDGIEKIQNQLFQKKTIVMCNSQRTAINVSKERSSKLLKWLKQDSV